MCRRFRRCYAPRPPVHRLSRVANRRTRDASLHSGVGGGPVPRLSRILAGLAEGFYERIAASHQGRIYKPSQVRHMKPVTQRPHAIRSPATITKIPTTKIQCVAAL